MPSALLYLAYLPNIDWFSKFLRYQEVWIEKEENFLKSTYRNRCEIGGANNKQMLSIPIIGGRDHHQLYKEVHICYKNDWQHIHWQSIRSAYGSAPYFEHYADSFSPFYQQQHELLFDYNLSLLNTLLRLLRLNKKPEFTSSYEKEHSGKIDLRYSDPGKRAYASKAQNPYYQVFEERNGFMQNLSVIDLLMNEGPAAIDYLQQAANKINGG